MSRFYIAQIDTIFLSSDGTNTGTPCKLQISGADDLITPITGRAEPSANGTPIFQNFAWTAGKQFEINIETINAEQWDALKTLINDSLAENETFTVTGTGDAGNFSVTAAPLPQKPFSAVAFINGRIKGATLRLITV